MTKMKYYKLIKGKMVEQLEPSPGCYVKYEDLANRNNNSLIAHHSAYEPGAEKQKFWLNAKIEYVQDELLGIITKYHRKTNITAELHPDTNFQSIPLDSLDMVEIEEEIEHLTGIHYSTQDCDILYNSTSPRDMAFKLTQIHHRIKQTL